MKKCIFFAFFCQLSRIIGDLSVIFAPWIEPSLAKWLAILRLKQAERQSQTLYDQTQKKKVSAKGTSLSRRAYERRLRRSQKRLLKLEAQERLRCQTKDLIHEVRKLLHDLIELAYTDIS